MSRPREQGGLFKHINGYWYWRRTNPKTGLREVRSTGMDRKDLAMRVAAKLDDEWEREVAGLQSYDWARRSLLELADEWLGEVKLKVEEKTGKQKAQLIGRALKDLNLRVVAELDDLAALDRRLKRLMKPARTLYRCYQLPLKQLSTWMAENNRYAERDLLVNWKRIAHDRGSERRALLPDEVARAFAAADRLDAMHKRKAPLRPALVALLVTARASARSSTGTSTTSRRTGSTTATTWATSAAGTAPLTRRPRRSSRTTSAPARRARYSSPPTVGATRRSGSSTCGARPSASGPSTRSCPTRARRTASSRARPSWLAA